jgi:hypothetical protein
MQKQTPKRKSLEDLLEDPEAKAFIHSRADRKHAKKSARQHANMPERQNAEERISVSVKVPKRVAEALWQAMHERTSQHRKKTLPHTEPHEKQDIVSQALEHWLTAKGYLK